MELEEKPSHKILIANRGEIAIRIINAANELDIPTLAIYSKDDSNALHIKKAEEAIPLSQTGVAAYLDLEAIIKIAKSHSCTMIHPGYGFLSENSTFAQRCEEEGIKFIGPNSSILNVLGDKIKARTLAKKIGVAVLPGTHQATSLDEVKTFFSSLAKGEGIMIKALSGGGGRGMRVVHQLSEIEDAYKRCQSEAQKAFGNGDLYVEKYLPIARHIEVQVIGDGESVSHIWERECSVQRRNQKIVEIAPCPGIHEELRSKILESALKIAQEVQYECAGTFEFLVKGKELSSDASFYFLEANPRIQVEHTVTEEVAGVDIVKFQIEQALGASLEQLGLNQNEIRKPKGFAIQARINMEQLNEYGEAQLKTGTLNTFDLPFGKGIRVETLGYKGYKNNPHFDPLLAKLIVYSESANFKKAIKKAYKNLCSVHIEGIQTNLFYLQNILQHPLFINNQFYTQFIGEHLTEILNVDSKKHIPSYFKKEASEENHSANEAVKVPEGLIAIEAPMPGSIVDILIEKGAPVQTGQQLLIMEAMKMESVVLANQSGTVKEILVSDGDVVSEKQVLFIIEPQESDQDADLSNKELDLDLIRPELAELNQRKAHQLDENRPAAVAKRKKKGKQTARENVTQLCDEDSFVEYGSLVVAAQRSRRSLEDLVQNTPADGIITGIGAVNGAQFGEEASKCMILCYDYMVLAGTQGMFGHMKTDRVLEIAYKAKLPIILFAEGGGGRPGDTDFQGIGGLHIKTFAYFARQNGVAPRIAIVSGYCFAGNAALAGCSDVIIATEDTCIGMGGPAMIEGGGLGKYHPKQVGPVSVQAPNGVLDLVVKDETEAIIAAKKYLSYFQGSIGNWECEDQRILRHLIPENRRRVYDIRKVIEAIADKDSVLELRKDYAIGVVTAFIRIEGKPLGLIANNPKHLGGALDAEGSGKAARFVQLCSTYDIPILSLCDTPGFMVGPEAEKTALVRHTSRLFTAGAKSNVPFFTVILRKAYGLGSMAMAAGGFHEPFMTVSWPTGEFGGMGLEGAVRLGFKKQLEAVEDPKEREALFQKMVAKSYQHGKAINTASYLEIDEVIDPKDTRKWILNGLSATVLSQKGKEGGRGFVDTW